MAVALVAVLLAAGGWFQAYSVRTRERSNIFITELQPIATLLHENQGILDELRAEPYAETDSGILESYLAKIRRDGVPKHADMKQRLDQLSDTNIALVTLIKAYTPHAMTPSFRSEGDKFRSYASVWRDRWYSVMELFMAGGNYAVSEVPFPKGLSAAVDAEIAVAQ